LKQLFFDFEDDFKLVLETEEKEKVLQNFSNTR